MVKYQYSAMKLYLIRPISICIYKLPLIWYLELSSKLEHINSRPTKISVLGLISVNNEMPEKQEATSIEAAPNASLDIAVSHVC